MTDAMEIGGATYRIANLRGLSERTGNSAKQITKQAKAAKLQPPNMSNLSHLLTVAYKLVNVSWPMCVPVTHAQTSPPPPLSSTVPAVARLVLHV